MENIIQGAKFEVFLAMKKPIAPECIHSGKSLTRSLMWAQVSWLCILGNCNLDIRNKRVCNPWDLLP